MQFAEPFTSIIPSGFASPKPLLIWVGEVHVNAKNGFGGYTGFQTYQFAWRDGKIVAHFTQENGFWIYEN